MEGEGSARRGKPSLHHYNKTKISFYTICWLIFREHLLSVPLGSLVMGKMPGKGFGKQLHRPRYTKMVARFFDNEGMKTFSVCVCVFCFT